jgi:hypothetical protein
VGLHGNSNRGVRARDLLQSQIVGHEVSARSAVLFWKRQPHQTEAGHLCDYVVRELLLAVEFGGARPDLTLGEVASEISPLALFFCRVEIHGKPPDPSD